MANHYPPGMTQREFDRATADSSEDCPHGEWAPECQTCDDDARAEAADRKYDEMRDRSHEPD